MQRSGSKEHLFFDTCIHKGEHSKANLAFAFFITEGF